MSRILFAFLLIILGYSAFAQSGTRHISFRTVDQDSVSLPLNEGYFLIEDSCAQIIRNCRFNFTTKRFHGKFSDVSKANPALIVSTGTYSDDGLKNGLFTSWYLNGKLQARGDFKDDKYAGKWEMYYNDGKPELTFEVTDGNIVINDAWDLQGKKVVDNGNGVYRDDLQGMYWMGKLLNGRPEGRWNLMRTDDISNTAISTERYKKGEFKGGSTGQMDYTNASHINLVDPFKLPFVNAEKMYISQVACNGTKSKHIVGAQYEDGLKVFSSCISEAVSPFFSKADLKGINNTIDIAGEISEKGNLINMKNNGSFNEDIAMGIIRKLSYLPPLHPATVDGKPVKQKFIISFNISDNVYRFTYRFLDILVD